MSQTVNPYSASSAEAIERVFPQADVVRLYRSYRSTMEITAFAQRITPNPDIIPWNGTGPSPSSRASATRKRSCGPSRR
ncbi:hypothetical protein ACFQT0_30720 [Hymenobacter humi]|uniref:Uncharacterized protein n=1 Tax=Hymenobacter humi TaxID=1411620 RepID=A0ABW2UGR5_9BACT